MATQTREKAHPAESVSQTASQAGNQSVSQSALQLQNEAPPTENWPVEVRVIFSSTPEPPVPQLNIREMLE